MSRPKLTCYVMAEVNLSLEDFHNAGMTPEQTKAVIERFYDPLIPHAKLHCAPTGINRNWKFKVMTTEPETVDFLLDEIEWALQDECDRLSFIRSKEKQA